MFFVGGACESIVKYVTFIRTYMVCDVMTERNTVQWYLKFKDHQFIQNNMVLH